MPWTIQWTLLAVALLSASGLLALTATRLPRLCTGIALGGALGGAILGLVPAFFVLGGGDTATWSMPWVTTMGGAFTVELDPLSAFFLVPVLVVTALAAVYGGAYWLPSADKKSLGAAWLWYNLLTASMVLVVLARNALLFLVAWEVMAVTSFLLVVFDDEKEGVRQAGWLYLAATHLGTALLLAMFILLKGPGGSLEFAAMTGAGRKALAAVVFVMALVGFGTKAGFVPFHIWLPEAHPAAPSHVSAVLSAVMIKLGIYGILRVALILGTPAPWWGPVLLAIGLVGALLGISMALYQRDLKRALAYSSIENVSLIALGLGIGLWGYTNGQTATTALGIGGALLHVWNHSLMKGLMFLSAGSVLHSTGTRDIEQLGGLMKRMPLTGTVMVIGAVALAGLPPLNGFVGEWLMYLGLLRGGLRFADARGMISMLSISGLVIIGGLAVICFVRLIGIAMLGEPRSEAARHAHESPAAMIVPMIVLVLLCLVIAAVPGLVVEVLARPAGQVLGLDSTTFLANLSAQGASPATLGIVNVCVWGGLALIALVLLVLIRRHPVATGGTWGCGYAAPTPRIQYTGRSFAETMADHLLPQPIRPDSTVKRPQGFFPAPGDYETAYPEPLTEDVYQPFFSRMADRCARLWWLQHGKVYLYLLYLLILVVVGLAWASLWTGVGS